MNRRQTPKRHHYAHHTQTEIIALRTCPGLSEKERYASRRFDHGMAHKLPQPLSRYACVPDYRRPGVFKVFVKNQISLLTAVGMHRPKRGAFSRGMKRSGQVR